MCPLLIFPLFIVQLVFYLAQVARFAQNHVAVVWSGRGVPGNQITGRRQASESPTTTLTVGDGLELVQSERSKATLADVMDASDKDTHDRVIGALKKEKAKVSLPNLSGSAN